MVKLIKNTRGESITSICDGWLGDREESDVFFDNPSLKLLKQVYSYRKWTRCVRVPLYASLLYVYINIKTEVAAFSYFTTKAHLYSLLGFLINSSKCFKFGSKASVSLTYLTVTV